MPARVATRRTATSVVLACLLALAGCTSLEGAGSKGYVSGNGQVSQVDSADRKSPISLTGEDLDGGEISLADLRGKVVVVNVWGAWCTGCRKEAPDLVEAAEETIGDDVAFVGIDVRDPSVDSARGFVRTFEVPYPSVYDPSGASLLEFHGDLTPNAIPSTVVLDREGRVAARILGELPSKDTLVSLIDEVVAEDG